MKLNPDCIRDILLTVEEKSTYAGMVRLPDKKVERLKTYSEDEALYHLRQCDLSGYFYEADSDLPGLYLIRDLTPKGHEFVGKVRDPKNWMIVKRGISAVRGYSLDVIRSISEGVASAAISSFVQSLNLGELVQ